MKKIYIAEVRCGCGKRVDNVNTEFKVRCPRCLSLLWLTIGKKGILPWIEFKRKKKKAPEIESYMVLKKKFIIEA